jgi:uncharacterized protein (TIGR00255 family)
MIKSMTGFGKASTQHGSRTIHVEIRSLNSRSAEVSLKVPSALRDYEPDLRNEISKLLERGKIDLSVQMESDSEVVGLQINMPVAKAYHGQLKKLSAELNEKPVDIMRQVLSFPDIFISDKKEADEGEWKKILDTIKVAAAKLNEFRTSEGKSLYADFQERISKITGFLGEVEVLDKSRLSTIKERIKGNLLEMIGMDNVDKNRFEQELIYYIERLDINEEKVRLRSHLEYFIETCKENSPGRKLNFISQEIGREINTIGSKAADAKIQRLVVMMKDELEKIKEQTSNVL